MNGILKTLKKKVGTYNFISSENILKNEGKIGIFFNKQKLRGCVTGRSILKESIKGILQ